MQTQSQSCSLMRAFSENASCDTFGVKNSELCRDRDHRFRNFRHSEMDDFAESFTHGPIFEFFSGFKNKHFLVIF